MSVAMTVPARSIMVPSKATRTLRLTALAVLPATAIMWLTRGGFATTGPATLGPSAVTLTVVFQTLLMIAVIWMATITSRTLYDLRRSIREANELGQYALEEKLRAGGMGEVWRARHRLLFPPARGPRCPLVGNMAPTLPGTPVVASAPGGLRGGTQGCNRTAFESDAGSPPGSRPGMRSGT